MLEMSCQLATPPTPLLTNEHILCVYINESKEKEKKAKSPIITSPLIQNIYQLLWVILKQKKIDYCQSNAHDVYSSHPFEKCNSTN